MRESRTARMRASALSVTRVTELKLCAIQEISAAWKESRTLQIIARRRTAASLTLIAESRRTHVPLSERANVPTFPTACGLELAVKVSALPHTTLARWRTLLPAK